MKIKQMYQRLFRSSSRGESHVLDQPREDDALEMLGELGVACVRATMATSDIEDVLTSVANQKEITGFQVFVLPTLVIIEMVSAQEERIKIFPVTGEPFRLDQAGLVEQVVALALSEDSRPEVVISRLTNIKNLTPRFGPGLTIFGHGLLTLGFGLVLNPTITAIPIYFTIGILVGVLLLLGQRLTNLRFALPVLIPFGTTAAVMLLIPHAGPTEIVRVVAPALMSFLPGLPLTISIIDMTRGQVVAGSSRLIFGATQMGLLAFGVYGAFIVLNGFSRAESLTDGAGWWSAWAGVLFVGIGYFLFSSAPKRSLLWILFALFVAYTAQFIGNYIVGSALSSAIGAMVVIPAVYLVSRFNKTVSSSVMLTCAYWLMVPGALGFLGMSQAETANPGGASTLLHTGLSLVALAIGIVLGLGISHDTTKFISRFHNSKSKFKTQSPKAISR